MTALLLARVSTLLAVTLVGAHLLRGRPARVRHAMWTVAFAALLVLPVLTALLPALDVPVPQRWSPATTGRPASLNAGSEDPAYMSPLGTTRDTGTVPTRTPAPVTPPPPSGTGVLTFTPVATLFGLWLLGSAAALWTLALSLARVRRIERSARDLDDVRWTAAAEQMAARVGCRPPRLRASERVITPMAGGILRPTVYLPASAIDWSEERRDIVLAHELAHLAQRDPLRHIAARVAVAAYWFHPLAWVAAARASAAREQACDETVLTLGTRPSAYARVLLEFAESQADPVPPLAALPIVERSLLEKRLMAILAHDAPTFRPARSLLAVVGIAVFAVVIAAARPAARAAITGEMPVPIAAAALAVPARAQVQPRAELICDVTSWRSFSGSMSSSDVGGRRVVYDMIGTSGADRIVMKTFGDLQICMVSQGLGDDRSVAPSEWTARAARTVIEARNGTQVQRLDLTRDGAGQRARWTVGGVERAFDAAAQDWRERMLTLLDTTWEISKIRGEVSSLRGEISSLRGEESSLRGEISSLRGDVSSKRGEISSLRGEESSLRGEISSIRGHVSSLRGAISSEHGAASSSTQDRGHQAEIARLEKEIRDYNADARIADVERRIKELDVEKHVEAIEREIRSLDTEAKIAVIEKQIQGLDVAGKSAAREKQIEALDADRRIRDLETRRDRELKDLQAAAARIR